MAFRIFVGFCVLGQGLSLKGLEQGQGE